MVATAVAVVVVWLVSLVVVVVLIAMVPVVVVGVVVVSCTYFSVLLLCLRQAIGMKPRVGSEGFRAGMTITDEV